MEPPVAFFVFNRPDTTQRVFEAIARAKPRRLLVVADGPRLDRAGEADACARARAVLEAVDWDCEVRTNYSDVNLGCRRRVSSGLDWIFSVAEQAVILEDDCVPHPDFFPFCAALLDRYRDDDRIMAISGSNFHKGRRWGDGSYYFSRYVDVWGWATWRRAWQYYDVNLRVLPAFLEQWAMGRLSSEPEIRHWLDVLRATYDGLIDTWDYQWLFAVWLQRGLVAVPNVNLVSNIGFGPRATHTKDGYCAYAALQTSPLGNLYHPRVVERHLEADLHYIRIRMTRPYSHRVRGYFRRRFDWLREQIVRP